MSKIDVVIGLQRGDEGKGRFVDLMAPDYDIIARGNGGANAGHTVAVEGLKPLALHQVPSGIAHPDKLNIIGNGTYVDPVALEAEIDDIRSRGIEVTPQNLVISDNAHLVMPHHILLDEARENGDDAQGSTKRGISFVARDKFLRHGIRTESLTLDDDSLLNFAIDGLIEALDDPSTGDIINARNASARWLNAAKQMRPFIADTVDLINSKLEDGNRVLAEGAQAHWLDINHGMYPMVTSSSTTVNGLLDGLGVPAQRLGQVTGVAKAIKSHVGGGPFVTEITDPDLAAQIRGRPGEVDSEYGASTNRPRRIGYFDLVELNNAVSINGVDSIALSKLDQVGRFGDSTYIATEYIYDGERIAKAPSSSLRLAECEPVYRSIPTWSYISDIRRYEDLPEEATDFVDLVEEALNTNVRMIGVGPERNQVIIR